MLAVYPWAFLIYGTGTPETLEQIRVNEAHFFICDYLENCRWGFRQENKNKKHNEILKWKMILSLVKKTFLML